MKRRIETGGDLPEIDALTLGPALIALTESGADSRWRVVPELPEKMTLGLNIREKDPIHVANLAVSFLREGQIQECVGDTMPDGTIRVWAGQHRFWAVELINRYAIQAGLPQRLKLRVRVFDREFSMDQILAVQLAENLHNQMRPEEEAEAIESLWNLYLQVSPEERKSMSDLARRIGRGEAKVRSALLFMTLDEKVRKLVEGDGMFYSLAVQIARLPREKQFGVANKIILYNFDSRGAIVLIEETLGEGKPLQGLFGEQELTAMAKQNHRLAFRNAADRAAKNADGYFRRVLALLRVLDDPARAEVTEPIQDILAGFIASADGFFYHLQAVSPNLASLILWHVRERIETGGT